MAVWAYITFFFGMVGLLYKQTLVLTLFFLSVIFIKDVKNMIMASLNFIKETNIKKSMKNFKLRFDFFSILMYLLLLFILLDFIISFVPPRGFDILTYHLAVPKAYIAAHKIVYMPSLLFSNFPMLVDMMYLNGLLLKNAILPNLFSYGLGLTFLLAVYSFCKKFFNKKIAILSSLIFYSFPIIIQSTSTAHVDIQLALFVFLSIYGLFLYFDSQKSSWLLLSAIFAGLTISSKITGILGVVGILVLLGFYLFLRFLKKKVSFQAVFFKLAIFCLIIFLIFAPWLLKTYVHTGNPVWPLFNDFFDGKYWDAKHQENYASERVLKRELSLVNYLRLPWDIHTLTGSDIGNIDADDHVGPFFLAFLPLYFLLRRKNKIINWSFFLLFVYITIWFFISGIFRHILFSVPFIAIISSYVFMELYKNKFLSKILRILLILTLCFNLLVLIGTHYRGVPVLVGLQNEDEYYSKYTGAIYDASKFINSNLPEDSRILLFRDNRGYFLEREYVLADPLLQAYVDYLKFENEDDYYKRLKEGGITHLLVNYEFTFRGNILNEYRYSKKILDMNDKLLKKYTVKLYDERGVQVNKLK